MGGGILVSPILQKLEEFLRAALLEKTHQWTFHRLHFRAGNLGDLAVTIDETACDLLELEVASDIGVHEDFREFSGRDDELWDEIDSVIPIAAELSGGCLISAEVSIELSRETESDALRAYCVCRRPG
jgi:hypothetical protein